MENLFFESVILKSNKFKYFNYSDGFLRNRLRLIKVWHCTKIEEIYNGKLHFLCSVKFKMMEKRFLTIIKRLQWKNDKFHDMQYGD